MPFENILEYVEGPNGLNWTLYPVQRFILKLYYGIELDASDRCIPVYFRHLEHLRGTLSEVEYLDFLHGEGRCNISDQSSSPRPGLVLATGRQIGKTTLAELIASYTVIQMLQMGNPHAAFGFDSPAHHLLLACYIGLNREMGNRFLIRVSEQVALCPDLLDSLVPRQNTREIRFTSPEGLRRGVPHGNLSVIALDSRPRIHASARAMLILDELAYMPEEQEIFNSNLPALIPPGRYVIMSTPRSAEGAFYHQFRYAMEHNTQDDPLALQIPTWEVHPNLVPSLRRIAEEDPIQFDTEYGAQWMSPQGSREVHIEIRV